MVKVSVIIPCYNASQFLHRCLDSISTQTFCDFEVICIDDCSTDKTATIISEYKKRDKRFVYIKNDQNSGPAKTRLNGISVAQGEYIAFCDSDDWFNPNSLSRMYEVAINHKADVVCFGHEKVFDKGKSVNYLLTNSVEILKPKEAVLLNVDALWSMLVRRSLVVEFPMPNIRNGEDMSVIPLYFAYSGRTCVIPDILYNYYIRKGSISNQANLSILESFDVSYNYTKLKFPKSLNKELEYIGIRNLLYGSMLALFKCRFDRKTANKIIERFELSYCNWVSNKYIHALPLFKRFYVWSIRHRLYVIMWMLSKIHTLIVRFS